ncbi:carbohydrate-binding domain-containing protein [Falsiroseomonas sp. E2-1-a20]|uniref:carbohydrate-binding domain-containing protein n=1 Tax=Falsiroseomonas sp. E2-1-a20 TaxID=3239300 RepID=UPI003F410FA6
MLKIGIAQDAWQGDARYTIALDGKQVGGERVAKASAAKGEMDIITLTGDFDGRVHKLDVTFLNDAWGGNAKADRNLYVEKLILNDVDLKKSADLMSNGTAKFEFKAVAEVAPAVSLGSGPDVLRVALSQDAYKGDATFLLFVDGKQLGGLRSVDASHAAREKDFIEIRGDFDAGDHILGVRFTNDLWGGSAAADRNLYVDSLELNGANLNTQAALLANGDVFLQF